MTTATCPHLLHHAINPRFCYTTANVRTLVYDCGICGARDVVDEGPQPRNEIDPRDPQWRQT